MNKNTKTDSKRTWISWIIWLAVIIGLSNIMGTGTANTTTMDADGLYFESASGYTSSIKWEDIQSVEVTECPEFGTLVEGTDVDSEKVADGSMISSENMNFLLAPKLKTALSV